MGVIGPKSLALRVKASVASFLNRRLKLDLSLDKTVISHGADGRIPFLGYIIKHAPRYTYTRAYAGQKRQVTDHRSGNLTLLVDIAKVMDRLRTQGFCINASLCLTLHIYHTRKAIRSQ